LKWLEVRVQADGEAAEAIAEVFNRFGEGGAVVEMLMQPDDGHAPAQPVVHVKTYLPADVAGTRRKIEEALWHLAQIYPLPAPEFCELAEQDWAEAWKTGYHVQHIGRRIVVAPSWEPYAPDLDEVLLRLDPGMAFGTGLHPSTRLCLQALEDRVRPGDRVLDVGTGSGILAIAAAQLGAVEVVGIDLDPVAVQVARDNVALNGVAERVWIEEGTLEQVSPVEGAWDCVVVNILAGVIIDLAPRLAARLTPSGSLIASGIIDESAAAVTEALASAGLCIIEQRSEKDWVALLAAAEWQTTTARVSTTDAPASGPRARSALP
jgi:ribosomal protein L11 methyltransferase